MNNFPTMTEAQRQELIADCEEEIAHLKEMMRGKFPMYSEEVYRSKVERQKIALAALTADTSKLAELAAKVRKVREDAADFDGDRRGMWEHQEEQEQLLLEEAVKYTAPPAPVLNLPGEISLNSAVYAVSKITHESLVGSYQDGWNACLSEVKRLNTQPSSPEASNER